MTLWGGRFADQPTQALWGFTADASDQRLLTFDIEGSSAHVEMLGETGILSADDAAELGRGLELILEEAKSGAFAFQDTDEDVHSAVERRLVELLGDVGKKLHTGRSRNDQVALDLRLYLAEVGKQRRTQIRELIDVIGQRALENADVVVASYTHLQQAQAVPLGHHLLAYAWMLQRDEQRFANALERVAVSPLGAAAGAGSTLPVDPEVSAAKLGLPAVFENSLDAVSARDFVAEYAFCCAQLMTHLSRLAEEVVLWASQEFGWITLPDSLSTGSSALPQKRNPDMAELVRGRSARVIGSVTTLLCLQKGLPLSYNRDLQEDKSAVFAADDTVAGALDAVEELLGAVEFHPPLADPETTALDLAEALVARGVPFRDAHRTVGELLAGLEATGRSLDQAGGEDLAGTSLQPGDLSLIDPRESIARRTTRGAATSDDVHRQVEALRAAMGS